MYTCVGYMGKHFLKSCYRMSYSTCGTLYNREIEYKRHS